MKFLFTLFLILSACSRSHEPKFKYMDSVVIVHGFYRGLHGKVIEYNENEKYPESYKIDSNEVYFRILAKENSLILYDQIKNVNDLKH